MATADSGAHSVLVTHAAQEAERALLRKSFPQEVCLRFLDDLPPSRRVSTLRQSEAVLSFRIDRELTAAELPALKHIRLLQFLSAGVDHVPFAALPPGITVACNAGAFARPMAEHVLAMTLALAKRLRFEHERMKAGEFDQSRTNRRLSGMTCGILGFGGIGKETARLMRLLGVRIYAVNTSGKTEEPVELVGTLKDLENILRDSDVVVVTLPLTRHTRRLIGRRELEWMRPDAVLINVARGEIIDEEALYEHLRTHRQFMAVIDAWWVEPLRQGEFRMDHPFLQLPNVLGSPHNSALTPGALLEGVRCAVENILRLFRGEPLTGVVHREDYLDREA